MSLATLAVVSVVALRNITTTQKNVALVIDEYQPAAFSALDFDIAMQKVGVSLGIYLKSGQDSFKQKYFDDLFALDTKKQDLEKHLKRLGDRDLLRILAALDEDLIRFEGYKGRLVELRENPVINVQALELANEKLNPLNSVISQAAEEMKAAEAERRVQLVEEASNLKAKIIYGDPLDPGVSFEQLLNEHLETIDLITNLRYSWTQVINGLRGFTAFRDDAFQENATLFLQASGEQIELLSQQEDLYLEQVDALERIKKARSEFIPALHQVFEIHRGDQAYRDVYLMRTKIGPLMNEMSLKLDRIVQLLKARTLETTKELSHQVHDARIIVTTLLIVGLVWGSFTVWIVGRSIGSRMSVALSAMQKIADGDGDLTQRLELKGNDELTKLADAFNRFVVKVRDAVCSVSNTVSHVDETSRDIANVSQNTSSGTEKQTAETRRAANAASSMLASSKKVYEKASEASTAVVNVSGVVEQGQDIVELTKASVDTLAGKINQAASVIEALEQDSDRIGSVLDVIRSIAEQTNLLALNAAIEAARAGDQGRGFAVVADEVRTLAGRTQEATAEIHNMMESLQSASHDAVSAMQQSRSQAQATVGHAESTQAALSKIGEEIESIRTINQGIQLASEDQNAVVNEINDSVATIYAIASDTRSGAQDLESSVNTLTDASSQLKQLMEGFKT